MTNIIIRICTPSSDKVPVILTISNIPSFFRIVSPSASLITNLLRHPTEHKIIPEILFFIAYFSISFLNPFPLLI